jgi:hypothetical protein
VRGVPAFSPVVNIGAATHSSTYCVSALNLGAGEY